MYGGMGRFTDREERRAELQEERRYQAFERRAVAKYPNLSKQDAIEAYQSEKESRQEGLELQRENWPIFGAILAGLVIFTFFKR